MDALQSGQEYEVILTKPDGGTITGKVIASKIEISYDVGGYTAGQTLWTLTLHGVGPLRVTGGNDATTDTE